MVMVGDKVERDNADDMMVAGLRIEVSLRPPYPHVTAFLV